MDTIVGNTVFHLKKYLIDEQGKEAWSKVLERMQAKDQDILAGIILSKESYPRTLYQSLLAGIDEILGRDVLIASARYQVDRQFGGFYGLMIKFVSTDMVLDKAESMWRKTWSLGRLTIADRGPERFTVRLSEFPINEAHRAHLEHYFAAFLEALLSKRVASSSERVDDATTEYSYRAPVGHS